MSKTSGRNRNGSYTNPRSKDRSRKEHDKKIENQKYQQSSNNKENKKSINNEKKKIKVKMSSTYGKVCRKTPEAKTIISTDDFINLHIEIPVTMKLFNRLSKQSKTLIYNFINANPWSWDLFIQKCLNHDKLHKLFKKYKIDVPISIGFINKHITDYLCKELTKRNFNKGRYYSSLDTFGLHDVFFYKVNHKLSKTTQWFFCINLSDFYDSYAAKCKQEHKGIPYQLTINHLIYNNIDKNVEPESSYPNGSRIAFSSGVTGTKYPIQPIHSVKYVLFNNDKNKRKAMEKKSDSYENNRFNKIVIKEIPTINIKK